ncbi:uncharacterized protein IL334_005221 [Kwoniella shivajii]|uniref:SAC3/GANP/THP3 conserved domain-containing protein n=1 Tax=Kwoniella shivajii TaxID=564305 RepID=A0ABZ1D2I8_9TREE|nr:hypothetical protein IL334_005221 [Kwoniella shivajii]
MPSAISALDSGNPDGEDESRKASRLAARAARFNKVLPGNRYKQLEEMRIKERKAFEEQGLIKVGKTQLGDAVDMRGTCEMMCSEYEREFREYTREVHPFEKIGSEGRMDPSKAVAAYSRSDAGAGHGDSAILPSDLRTPITLARTLDYLFSVIMPTHPPSTSISPCTPRKALGYSAGFIRDRTRAIRKEFAMQSSWGHEEAIASFERIARWHILCLRELQEESGTNVDMHIDSAELNRCFTSLRQHYNDRREESRVESPCPNESEFTAYMLIYDLNSKSVSIPFSELPSIIIDDPLVKIAWEIRRAAQRNFDTQKEGSKHNSELGMNLINRFIRLLKQPKIPFLLSCLVEIRLREMRRSALRSLRRAYPNLKKSDPIRLNEMGEVVERKMILIKTLDKILGCEEQETEDSAWDDIDYDHTNQNQNQNQESIAISKRFNFDIYEDHNGPIGALINMGSQYNDNKDAPYTRRWKLITEKRSDASYVDIVNGQAGVHMEGTTIPRVTRPQSTSSFIAAPANKLQSTPAFSFNNHSSIPTFTVPTSQPTKSASQTSLDFKSPGLPPDQREMAAKTEKTPITAPPSSSASPSWMAGTSAFPRPMPSAVEVNSIPKPSAPIAVPSSSFSFTPPPAQSSAVEPSTKKKRSADGDLAPSAKAPLFSSPSLFATPASSTSKPPSFIASPPSALTQPAKPVSPTLPPFSIPKPISPVTSSPLSSSTASPPRQRKRIASSVLSSSTSKLSSSVLRKSLAETRDDRQNRLHSLPDICDLLVDDVIQQMIADHLSSDLERYAKQQKAATEYQRRKVLRSEAILQWSQSILTRLADEETKRIANIALLGELKRRYLTRRAIRFWRSWAKTQRRNREEAEKKRGTIFTHLTSMGLSKSVSSTPRNESPAPIGDIDMSLEIERMDGLQIDIEINHAERTKDNFFSPSTFLTAITRHVGPFLSPQASSNSTFLPAFHTIVSIPPSDFGNPPEPEVQTWLNRKFLPSSKLDEESENDSYVVSGVMYDTKILESGIPPPRWCSIGMFVFEAPMNTDDERKSSENTADAQDRIGTLLKGVQTISNRYSPSLIVLTWEQETLEELGERLQISRELSQFPKKALVSLQLSDDLDERFMKALEILLPELTIKEQVIINLQEVISRLYPTWQRFNDISNIQLRQRPAEPDLAITIFKLGVGLINSIPSLVQSALGSVELEDPDKFNPIILPPFPEENADMSEVVERIADYFEHESLKGIDDLDLLVTPMRQAALLGHPLPLIPALQSLSFLVLGEIKDTDLELRIFYPTQTHTKSFKKGYLNALSKSYEQEMDKAIQKILPPPQTWTITTNTNSNNNDELMGIDQSPPPKDHHQYLHKKSPNKSPKTMGNGKKRVRGDENISPNAKSESKASKNARLLKALKDVEKTLLLVERESNELEVL